MTPDPRDPASPPTGGGPRAARGALARDLLLGVLPLSAVAGSALVLLDLPFHYVAAVAVGWLLLGAMLLAGAPPAFPGTGIGGANRVTLARGTLVLPVAGLLPWARLLGTAGLWWVVAVSALALVLDGVDGRVARRTGTGTAFGARFDMELDAFLLLALALLAWLAAPVGPWVILIGALRYLFVVAGWMWPVLRDELPGSFRRKAVCVVQGVGLLVVLGPIVPPLLANAAAIVALTALVYSFGLDTAWLIRQGRTRRP